MTQADDDLRDRLRRAPPVAMKARDRTAVTALRSALAAIDNAEAFDPDDALAEGMYDPLNRLAGSLPTPTTLMWTLRILGSRAAGLAGPPPFAGTVAGVGVTEVERRGLTPGGGHRPRRDRDPGVAADVLEAAGKQDHAEPLRAQMRVLLAHVNRT